MPEDGGLDGGKRVAIVLQEGKVLREPLGVFRGAGELTSGIAAPHHKLRLRRTSCSEWRSARELRYPACPTSECSNRGLGLLREANSRKAPCAMELIPWAGSS